MPRAQSAIEFMSGYGFVFLIIAIALALLFIFSSIPQTVLPTQCSFLSGFSCTDAIYTNTVHGSALLITAIDTQPGIVNISGFSGYINFAPSYTGVCAPNVAVAGQVVYCTANFTFKPKLGNIYSGSFKIAANYCANGSSNLTTAQCQTSATYTYGGNVRAQSFFFPLSGVWQLPVNVINSQSSGVPPQGQIMIKFTPSTYGTYERSDLGNIRFYSGAKELNSWCESNCTSSATSNAIFWIKIPQGIPANTNTLVNIYFLPTSIEYDGIFAGEAPQLSQSYAQYDNGQNVFNFYDNFNGQSLNTNIWSLNGATATVSNGLTYNAPQAGNYNYMTALAYLNVPYTIDYYGNSPSTGYQGFYFNIQSAAANANAYLLQISPTGATDNFYTYISGSYSNKATWSPSSDGLTHVRTLQVGPADVPVTYQIGYVTTESLSSMPSTYVSGYFGPRSYGDNVFWQWVRVRAYVAVMPTTSFGSVAKIG
ncbi:MAG: hypothetical protein KGH66_00885 [Candidatus Micrarchaeota archaeon]|nr:hypothetical protein [Candidatus Micrarchaeota archaeon]